MKKTFILLVVIIMSFGSFLTGCEEDNSSVISLTENISSNSASSKSSNVSSSDSESSTDSNSSSFKYKAPENSPVALHGKLSVDGNDLVDEHGEIGRAHV